MIPKPGFKDSARKLGIWQHGRIMFESEDHVAILSDYAIYDYRLRGGTNAVERLWKLGKTQPGTPEHEVLAAMQEARFTILRAVEVVPGTGALVDDLFYGERHFLADVTFSESSEPGVTMAARLLFIEDFVMTTGAALGMASVFADDVLRIMGDSVEGVHEFVRSLGVANRSQLAARLIRELIAPREER